MKDDLDNPYVNIRITDRLSGVMHISQVAYRRKHAERIAKKNNSFRFKYEVVNSRVPK